MSWFLQPGQCQGHASFLVWWVSPTAHLHSHTLRTSSHTRPQMSIAFQVRNQAITPDFSLFYHSVTKRLSHSPTVDILWNSYFILASYHSQSGKPIKPSQNQGSFGWLPHSGQVFSPFYCSPIHWIHFILFHSEPHTEFYITAWPLQSTYLMIHIFAKILSMWLAMHSSNLELAHEMIT